MLENKSSFNEKGELHGIQYYYTDKKLTGKEYYKEGKIQKSENYYQNGTYASVISYDNQEKLDGTQMFYYPNGQLKEKSKYRSGELIEIRQYFENGDKKYEYDKNGIKEYYPGEELKSLKEMKEYELNGISCDFTEKGTIRSIKYIENGKISGLKEYIEITSSAEFGKNELAVSAGELEKIDEFESSYTSKIDRLLENLINKQKKVIKGELFKEKESKEKTR
jgi:MORN repeat variant.